MQAELEAKRAAEARECRVTFKATPAPGAVTTASPITHHHSSHHPSPFTHHTSPITHVESTFELLHDKMLAAQSLRRQQNIERRKTELLRDQRAFHVASAAHPALQHRTDKHTQCTVVKEETFRQFKVGTIIACRRMNGCPRPIRSTRRC